MTEEEVSLTVQTYNRNFTTVSPLKEIFWYTVCQFASIIITLAHIHILSELI